MVNMFLIMSVIEKENTEYIIQVEHIVSVHKIICYCILIRKIGYHFEQDASCIVYYCMFCFFFQFGIEKSAPCTAAQQSSLAVDSSKREVRLCHFIICYVYLIHWCSTLLLLLDLHFTPV